MQTGLWKAHIVHTVSSRVLRLRIDRRQPAASLYLLVRDCKLETGSARGGSVRCVGWVGEYEVCAASGGGWWMIKEWLGFRRGRRRGMW